MLKLGFGRTKCAQQSTLSQTLNAVTAENRVQMSESYQIIYRQHRRGFHHDYRLRPQILGVELSGMPCGKKAELASKGYFAKEKNRRGRQIGRVLATRYREVVTTSVTMGKLNPIGGSGD